MSIADKLQTIANNLATESEAVEQQTELLQQIRTALVGKTVPGDPGDSGSYDEGFADGYKEGEQEGYEKGHTAGVADGIEQGKAEAIESLPGGYIKVDPTWTVFDGLCQSRPSLGASIKYSDTANGKTFTAMCSGWSSALGTFTVPSWDLRNATIIQNMFIYSSGIVEIGEMNIPKVTNAANTFSGCSKLQKISFAPNCINVSISFASSSLLDGASIQSIIDGLADLTGKTAQTITFHKDVGNKLTQAQKDAASAKNWTLAY